MARDKIDLDLLCPSCGRSGTALSSEAENPVLNGRQYGVDEVPEGFTLRAVGRSPQETVIICDECEEQSVVA